MILIVESNHCNRFILHGTHLPTTATLSGLNVMYYRHHFMQQKRILVQGDHSLEALLYKE